MAGIAARFRCAASLAASGVLLASLAFAPAALGAWSSPAYVGSASSYISWGPEVAVANNGRAALMWTIDTDMKPHPVMVALRGEKGGFAAPLAIPGTSGLEPTVAITNSGRTFALWQRFDGTTPVGTSGEMGTLMEAMGSLRKPGGRFPTGVSLGKAENFGSFRVGFTPAGSPWAFASDFAGRWSPDGPLTPVALAKFPGFLWAVGANLDTAYGLSTFTPTRASFAVQRRSRTGVLGPRSRTLARYPCNGDEEEFTCDLPGISVGLDRDGRGLVAWGKRENGRTVVRVGTLYTSGVLGSARLLARLGAHASIAELKMNGDGDAILVVSDGGRLKAAYRSAGHSFGAFQTLSSRLRDAYRQVAIGPRGDVVVTSFSANGDLMAVVRRVGHWFGSAHRVGGSNAPARNTNGTISSQQQRAGIDGRGRVTVTWLRGVTRSSGARGRVQIATYTP